LYEDFVVIAFDDAFSNSSSAQGGGRDH